MRYYISDLHFYHRGIKEMDARDFATVFEMHEYMIEKWNAKVRKNDEVFILGDLSFGNGVETWEIMTKLNGKLTLIEGNHDGRFLDDKEFVDNFENVLSYDEKKDDGRRVILSHYPMPFYNHQFKRNNEDELKTYMLYGHVHNTFDEYLLNRMINEMKKLERESVGGGAETTPAQLINVFCVYSDYAPLTLDEWIELDKKRRAWINEEEAKKGGLLNYEDWKRMNAEMLIKAKEGWK